MPTATDQQLEQLKQKYQSVFNMIQQQQIRLNHVNMQDNKLFVQGNAPSADAKNRVWDQIKLVNPNWQSELIVDIEVIGQQQPAGRASSGGQSSTLDRTYTVKPGDTLSKIAKEMYGNSNEYQKIFDANRDRLSDPNQIRPGQELKIPA
jgi:nucleoid-associated protein YgaU